MENFLDEGLTKPLYQQKRFAELNRRALALSEQNETERWRRLHVVDAIFESNCGLFTEKNSLSEFYDFDALSNFREECAAGDNEMDNLKYPDVCKMLTNTLPQADVFASARESLKYQAQELKNLEQHIAALKASKHIVLEVSEENKKTKYMYFKSEKQLTDHFLKVFAMEQDIKGRDR